MTEKLLTFLVGKQWSDEGLLILNLELKLHGLAIRNFHDPILSL
jgi:hypothetical protein